jgi:hypothetical protein
MTRARRYPRKHKGRQVMTSIEDTTGDLDDLTQKILNLVDVGDIDSNTVLIALVNAFIYLMARNCPNCRKNIAKTLKKNIPEMLKEAELVAAQFEAAPEHLH